MAFECRGTKFVKSKHFTQYFTVQQTFRECRARVNVIAFGAKCVSCCLLPCVTRMGAGRCIWHALPFTLLNTKMPSSLRQRHNRLQMWAPVDQLLVVLMNMLSRKNEFQADAYAVKLGYAKGLQTGLVKLQLENLGNMVRDKCRQKKKKCCNSCDLGL